VLGSDGTLNEQASIQASGNIVDVATVDKDSTVFVSVDSIRKADSTQEWSTEPSSTLLEAFSAKSEAGSVTWGPCAKEIVAKINSTGTEEVSAATDVKQQKELNESLYNLGSLRKRGGEE
jgi:tRNA (guanine-N(7)-)-methyltransferase subunit TRM82